MQGRTRSIGHIAIPVWSIDDTRRFYGDVLGCPHGRLSETMIDFNFFGQHLVCHLASERLRGEAAIDATYNERLSRHFGVIVEMAEWKRIAGRLEGRDVEYVNHPPKILHEGTEQEEGLIFMLDPARNAVEFKGFDVPGRLSKALGEIEIRAT
ncbi:MAG: glyoxalase [Proteobacteria bacterium]|nr:glyoxalase [Pseudomonadota bacterium]